MRVSIDATPCIRVVSESGAHEVCRVELSKSEPSLFYDDLLARVCSSPATQAIFPGAVASTFRLCNAKGEPLLPYVQVREGETVYLHSGKAAGSGPTGPDPTPSVRTIMFGDMPLDVPASTDYNMCTTACEILGLNTNQYVLDNTLRLVPVEREKCTITYRDDVHVQVTKTNWHDMCVEACDLLGLNPLEHLITSNNRLVMRAKQFAKMVAVEDEMEVDMGPPVAPPNKSEKPVHVYDKLSGQQVRLDYSLYIPARPVVLRQACHRLGVNPDEYDLTRDAPVPVKAHDTIALHRIEHYVLVETPQGDRHMFPCGPRGLTDTALRLMVSKRLDVSMFAFVLYMQGYDVGREMWPPGQVARYVEKEDTPAE